MKANNQITGTMKTTEGLLINTVGGVIPVGKVRFNLSMVNGKPKVANNGRILGSTEDGLMYVYMDKEQSETIEFKAIGEFVWFELTPLVAPNDNDFNNAEAIKLDW